MRFRERWRKGAQTRGRAKRRKNAQTRARARRLRRDIRAGPPRTGSRERKNAQRSRPLQRKGGRVRGQARRRECARCRVSGDGGPLRVLNEKSTCRIFDVRATRPANIGPFQPRMHVTYLPTSILKINNICGNETARYSGRVARTPKILTSRFFIENAERLAIARHPAACAFAPPCLPPHAPPPPPLQRPAPLRVLSFARIRPRRSHSDIPPQAPCPSTRLRVFPPLRPPAHLRPLPPPLPESHMWGPPQENIPG